MAKFIKDFKRYDTEKSTEIAKIFVKFYTDIYIDDIDGKEKREVCKLHQTVFVTQKGNFFTATTSNAKHTKFIDVYERISVDKVVKLLCDNEMYGKVEEFFGDKLQDA